MGEIWKMLPSKKSIPIPMILNARKCIHEQYTFDSVMTRAITTFNTGNLKSKPGTPTCSDSRIRMVTESATISHAAKLTTTIMQGMSAKTKYEKAFNFDLNNVRENDSYLVKFKVERKKMFIVPLIVVSSWVS